MNKYIVEGCNTDVVSWVGSKDEYGFCERHIQAWHWFRLGYYTGQGFKVDGLLRKKVWNAAMKEFLEDCRTEIAARTQIVETVIREGGEL